jgi:hypothetical protein
MVIASTAPPHRAIALDALEPVNVMNASNDELPSYQLPAAASVPVPAAVSGTGNW